MIILFRTGKTKECIRKIILKYLFLCTLINKHNNGNNPNNSIAVDINPKTYALEVNLLRKIK